MSVTDQADRIASVGYDYASREFEPVAACNLCGSSDLTELARRDRYGYAVTLAGCGRCGLAFLSPRLTAEEYAEFYRHVYRPLVSAYHGRRIDAETLPADQRGYARELVVFLRESLSAPQKGVLDLGGSTGVVAAAVRDAFGATATVLDPAPDELAVAAAAGLETIAGFAEDFDDERSWDLVLLCQTIDHLLDPAATLAAMRRLTSPDGHAFVDALDYARVARRVGSLEGAVKIDHPYYLTQETAVAYLMRAGFEVVAERLSADDHWGFVVRPAERREPDWERLGALARRRLGELQALS
jgi:SAM-dependent methyltransferase